MLIKVITLPFDTTVHGFQDQVLRDFMKDKSISEVKEHFFNKDGHPYLTYSIYYQTHPAQNNGSRAEQESWQHQIDPADEPLYNHLKDWRNQQAKAESLPPYIIAKNQQLAQVAKLRPTTLAQLTAIKGFGEKKCKKYGKSLLACLQQNANPDQEPDHEPPPSRS